MTDAQSAMEFFKRLTNPTVSFKLVFSWGEIDCPPDMVPTSPLRRDRQPSRRYTAGRDWWKRFNEMEKKGAA